MPATSEAVDIVPDAPAVPQNVVPALEAHWELERLLGSGSQGAVWAARHRTEPTSTVAVKLLAKCGDAAREADREAFRAAVLDWRKKDGPLVVERFGQPVEKDK